MNEENVKVKREKNVVVNWDEELNMGWSKI